MGAGRAPDGDLYIGDNPVAMDNERDFGYRGNIGFAVPGVEIHFPLGPGLTLYIPCPSDIERMRKIFSDSRGRFGGALVRAVDTGDPFELTPENVEREKFLQVLYAGRWIFSATGAFALARSIIVRSPGIDPGPWVRCHEGVAQGVCRRGWLIVPEEAAKAIRDLRNRGWTIP